MLTIDKANEFCDDNFIICSDSLNALSAVQGSSFSYKTRHPFVLEIKSKYLIIAQQGNTVKFSYVLSHYDISMNDRVNIFLKRAITSRDRFPYILSN